MLLPTTLDNLGSLAKKNKNPVLDYLRLFSLIYDSLYESAKDKENAG